MSQLPKVLSGLSRPAMLAVATLIATTPILHAASPVTLSFEGFASPSGLVNIPTSSPYNEAGFTLTPTNGSSAVFEATAASDMPGNATSWFGFAESNTITLRHAAGRPFDLISLLVGRSTIATNSTVSVTFTGMAVGGNNLSGTRFGLNTATLATLNWTNLTQLVLTSSDDAGVDDITLTLVPEPFAGALAGVALLGSPWLRRRKCMRVAGTLQA